jgi:hypothetical protein
MNLAERFQLQNESPAELKQARDEEFTREIEDHKRRVDRARRALRFLKGAGGTPLDFLAIGDSWYKYPLDGQLLLPPYDFGIVAKSQLQSMGNPNPIILNQAWPGQASTAVLSRTNQETIITLLENGSNWMNGTGPDGILISAGGDDIVGEQFAIYIEYGGAGLSGRFQGVLDLVQASYEDLFDFRDKFASGVPIIGHCYDYAIPSGVPAAGILGPWLRPSLDFALYNAPARTKAIHDMIEGFYGMLNGLTSKAKNNFHLVDTRKTIAPNKNYPDGWANEIHPYTPGFTALAKKYLAVLQNLFPGRI